MFAEGGGELEHVDRVFADHFRELGVGADQALVGRVLEMVRLDVVPDRFGGFGTGEGGFAKKVGQGG